MPTIYIIANVGPKGRATISGSTSQSVTVGSVSATPVFRSSTPTIRAVIGSLSNIQEDPGSSLGAAAGATGQGKQFLAAQKSLTADAYRSCGLCPDSLVNSIAEEVREVSRMVLRVKRIVTMLNRALESAEQIVLEFINGFIDLIPAPPVMDLRELVRMVMCPLLAQSLAVTSYQRAITSAHRLASNSTSGGSLNPLYYPLLASATSKYLTEDALRIATAAANVPKALWTYFANQWSQMAQEFWRRFTEYLSDENPFTDFGSGGNVSDQGTARANSAANVGRPFLKVNNLSDIVNPTEGMVVYIESQLSAPTFSGSVSGAVVSDASTVNYPMQGSSARSTDSSEDSAVKQVGTGAKLNRQRFIFRNGQWTALPDSSIKRFIKRLFRLLMELWSVVRNIGYFAVRTAVTKGSVALVRATCPSVYASSAYPFKEFDDLTRNFRMDGFVPSGIGTNARPFVDAGMRLVLKIEAWAAASFITVV